ncbi:MAG: methyltransferase domain-containing protein [Pseudomonadota bacterium]|nr:methyltransferase domain-containing protein [Pseudomonadota bacterium]
MTLQDLLSKIWAEPRIGTLVGFGFAAPFLGPLQKKAKNVFCLMPGQQGVISWPNEKNNVSVLVEETSWPLETETVDRLVIAHGLETCDRPKALLQEIWRVLRPSSRVLFIVPNRTGLWARNDFTPFGYGRPYTIAQVERQLIENRFTIERHFAALYAPPSEKLFWLKSGKFLERLGKKFGSRVMAGAIVIEASKQLFAMPKVGLRETISAPLDVLEDFAKPKPVSRTNSNK